MGRLQRGRRCLRAAAALLLGLAALTPSAQAASPASEAPQAGDLADAQALLSGPGEPPPPSPPPASTAEPDEFQASLTGPALDSLPALEADKGDPFAGEGFGPAVLEPGQRVSDGVSLLKTPPADAQLTQAQRDAAARLRGQRQGTATVVARR